MEKEMLDDIQNINPLHYVKIDINANKNQQWILFYICQTRKKMFKIWVSNAGEDILMQTLVRAWICESNLESNSAIWVTIKPLRRFIETR